MTVNLKPETLGIEIKKAIVENRNKRAKEWNDKQDMKYIRMCLNSGNDELIEYGNHLLNKLKNN